MSADFFLRGLFYVIPLILSLTVHEFAHAWSAWKLGDDTAAQAGRLSLNPLVHIDPIGTILLPLLQVPFGWARPVPVNPARFRRGIRMATGMMLTAAAGPAANLLLAIVCTVGFGLAGRFAPGALQANAGAGEELLQILIIMNVGLAVFNLLPIPPLDGSRIVDGLMPYRLRPQWEAVTRFAPFVLLGVIFFGRGLIIAPRDALLGLLQQLLNVFA